MVVQVATGSTERFQYGLGFRCINERARRQHTHLRIKTTNKNSNPEALTKAPIHMVTNVRSFQIVMLALNNKHMNSMLCKGKQTKNFLNPSLYNIKICQNQGQQ
jgi:hypothetical protein